MLRKMIIAALVFAPALSLAAQDAATGSERAAAKRPGIAGQFKRADTDGNGMLSRAEAEKGAPRLAKDFEAIDTNRDGQLAPDEIRAWRKARHTERHARREGAGARFDEHFAKADADRDGALTKTEAEKGMPRLARKFERVDADRDGKVTRDELRAYLQARRAARTGTS